MKDTERYALLLGFPRLCYAYAQARSADWVALCPGPTDILSVTVLAFKGRRPKWNKEKNRWEYDNDSCRIMGKPYCDTDFNRFRDRSLFKELRTRSHWIFKVKGEHGE